MAKETKKKRKVFGFGPMGWLVVILLLIGGGGFGLSQSGFFGGERNGNGNGGSASSSVSEENGSTQETNHVDITVTGSEILWNNEPTTIEEFSILASEMNEKTTFTVTDDSAIKATYEEVVEILNDNQIAFQEAESQ